MPTRIRPEDPEAPILPGLSHYLTFAVVNGRLLLRLQSSIVLPCPEICLEVIRTAWLLSWFGPCKHYIHELVDIIDCALNHSVQYKHKGGVLQTCSHCKELRRCHTCPSEYVVQVKPRSASHSGVILHLIKWSDPGNGQLPFSREWQAQSVNGDATLPIPRVFDLRGPKSVRWRFEHSDHDIGNPNLSDPDFDVQVLRSRILLKVTPAATQLHAHGVVDNATRETQRKPGTDQYLQFRLDLNKESDLDQLSCTHEHHKSLVLAPGVHPGML